MHIAALRPDGGSWQAPGWLLELAAAPCPVTTAQTCQDNASSSCDSSSSDEEVDAHAATYSSMSSSDDEGGAGGKRGARSRVLVPAQEPSKQPKGLPPVALRPPDAEDGEPDQAAGAREQGGAKTGDRAAEEDAKAEAEREERRNDVALRRLTAILGGKGDVSRARQKLLEVRSSFCAQIREMGSGGRAIAGVQACINL